jgi:hypothetical protein
VTLQISKRPDLTLGILTGESNFVKIMGKTRDLASEHPDLSFIKQLIVLTSNLIHAFTIHGHFPRPIALAWILNKLRSLLNFLTKFFGQYLSRNYVLYIIYIFVN